MKATLKIVMVLSLMLSIGSCKQEYPLPKNAQDLNLLVVEGLLNAAVGPTTVRLSRTVNPSDTASIRPELRAQVTVEGENSTVAVLVGNSGGEYTINQLNLNPSVKYRLRIKRENGKEYLSDFVPVQPSPAIDSVHWRRTNDGVQLLVTTHDPQNSTWYYRWEYDETWEIHSDFISNWQYVEPDVVIRPDPHAIYFCWRYDASRGIFVNSSAKLSQDVISSQPLNSIPSGSERISVRYSILVRQYALTEHAYQFWEIMKKNTEQVGTLFDPQPSQLLSNIHSLSDPEEAVIGYVSAGSYSEKRLFITRSQASPWNYRTGCTDRIIPLDSLKFFYEFGFWIPLEEWTAPSGFLGGYVSSVRPCVDCTLRGSNIRPSFW